MDAREQRGPWPVDRAGSLPLWAQVYDDLRRRVDAEEFTDTFLGEHALVDEYRVSRHTVREALRRLRAEGVVTAERGRPPRLARPEIEQPLGALYSLFASVEQGGQRQRSVVRVLDVRSDPPAAARLDLHDAASLLYLERLRLADEEPLAVDRVWLPAELAGPLLDADFTHTALYDELDRRCGVRLTTGSEHIRTVLPTGAERRLLALPPDVAVFSIDRLGSSAAGPIEWRQTLVRGDRFSLIAHFSASNGYRLDVAGPPQDLLRRAPTKGHDGATD